MRDYVKEYEEIIEKEREEKEEELNKEANRIINIFYEKNIEYETAAFIHDNLAIYIPAKDIQEFSSEDVCRILGGEHMAILGTSEEQWVLQIKFKSEIHDKIFDALQNLERPSNIPPKEKSDDLK